MKFHRLLVLFCMGASLTWVSAARAQSTAKKGEPRKQTLSFEDELVEGATQKPELFYLFQKKNFNYKRLIKLRENFIPEVRRNAEDVVKKTER